MVEPSWTDIVQAVGTWAIGGVGFWFIHKQNEILERQNKVMANQADLNERLIKREDQERDKADTMDTLEKLVLAAIREEDDRVREYGRLLEKGLTPAQLKYYASQSFPDNNGTVHGMVNTLHDKYTRKRAIEALENAHNAAKQEK